MSRTAKIIASAVATAALSFGSVGLVSASTMHVDAAARTGWCC